MLYSAGRICQMKIQHVHIVLGISGQFGGARTVVWPHPCVKNACITHIKRTHSIEYNIGLVPIFEQPNYGKLAPVTISFLHLLSTPFSFCDNTSCNMCWLITFHFCFIWLLLWLFQEHVVTCHLSFHFDQTCVYLDSFIHAFTLPLIEHALTLLLTYVYHALDMRTIVYNLVDTL